MVTTTVADTLAYVQTQLELSDEDLADRLPNGRTRLMDRVLWAITYLRKSCLIKSVSWGVFQIKERGGALLAERQGAGCGVHAGTPEEELQRIFGAIQKRLEVETRDAFKASSPTFFEKVVVNLLVAMGYGGSIEDAGRMTRRTGDDGIQRM